MSKWAGKTQVAQLAMANSMYGVAAALLALSLSGCMVSTPLHMAIEGRNTPETLRLIKKSKDIDRPNGQGATAPHVAAKTGQVKTASALLEKGAGTDIRDQTGATPLINACANGHTETAKVLIEAGSRIAEMDKGGNTCLLRASFKGHTPVVKSALTDGANISHQNNLGRTALSMAASGGHDGLVRDLIKSGAPIDEADELGVTAYDIAIEQNNRSLTKTFLQSGAKPTKFSASVPRPGWFTAQSHFFAAEYYEARDKGRALTYYRMAEKNYAYAVDEWKDHARAQNGRIAGAVFSTLLITAVAGAGAATPSIYEPVKARAQAGAKRKLAEDRLGISQRKVAELGG